jgi:hypothetical protein
MSNNFWCFWLLENERRGSIDWTVGCLDLGIVEEAGLGRLYTLLYEGRVNVNIP